MKATEAKLLELLKKSPQFVIPIYQRTYSWTKPQCQQLWDDILRTGQDDEIPAHFVGSIVYIQQSLYSVSDQSSLLVIDGQQRLTTVVLILEALARAVKDTEPMKGFSAVKIRDRFLRNVHEDDEDQYKLLLTQTDKESLIALIDQKPMPKEFSVRVKENFEFFSDRIKSLDDLTALCTGLAKLMVVDVALTSGQDNPQLIFESMNSTGKELSQADLIRNSILMGLKAKHQTQLYKDHWRPMEVNFGQEAYGEHFDKFMRDYLTIKTREIPRLRDVYDAFKAYAHQPDVDVAGVDALVADIHTFAGHYCNVVLGKEQQRRLKESFSDLRELKSNVAYPFLLEVYADYTGGRLTAEEMEQIVRLVESYVFRRAVCNIPTNSMNKTFSTLLRVVDKENYLESVFAQFLLLRSYRRFPRDEEFKREIQVRDLYNFRSRSYWLRRMENHNRKERVQVEEYTVEHIMPQNDDLSQAWRDALGPDWERVQKEYLHKLGNLTLTGYNSEYSDRPFSQKRDMADGRGFKNSPLKLNQGLGTLDDWNEEEILARADRLATLAQQVWVSPRLDEATLDQYRSKPVGCTDWSIDDHPNIADGEPMKPLFDRLRAEIMVLDESVTEVFLKYYVAYKAETNFADVITQKSQLRVSINLPYDEIDEPKDNVKDVTNKGRWGNGMFEIKIKTEDEIPYVIGFVRKALERQLDNVD